MVGSIDTALHRKEEIWWVRATQPCIEQNTYGGLVQHSIDQNRYGGFMPQPSIEQNIHGGFV